MKKILTILILCLLPNLLAAAADAGRWDKELLALFARMPVQDGGRVKPLDTYARFKLLQLHGKQSIWVTEGGKKRKLSATEWLLDCLFFPELALDYPTFSINDSAVLTAIEVVPHEKRRDRYSYSELEPGFAKLFDQASEYYELKEKSPHQKMVVGLAGNVNEFSALIGCFDFARPSVLAPMKIFSKAALSQEVSDVAAFLRSQSRIQAFFSAPEFTDRADARELEAVFGQVNEGLQRATNAGQSLCFLPPSDNEQDEWLSAGKILQNSMWKPPREHELQRLIAVQQVVQAAPESEAFHAAARSLAEDVINRAQERGEYRKIELEVKYYKLDLFMWSLVLFTLGFILVAVSWAQPKLASFTLYAMMPPALLMILGITMRCIIRGRPPVTTLYETIVFCTAVVVIMGLALEWMNRQRIGVAMAAFLGMVGMQVAMIYEARDAADTMPSMVAVLDSNFWLASHVITIIIGYGAGLLAAAMSHVWLFLKLFRAKPKDAAFCESLTSMVYGSLCFALFFSFVGTVLGGIWANESWGRFWGWDPKENGALLIVLWQLILLHARTGGFIKELGINLGAIFGGVVVILAWWGVNLLGVGLHNYGFTQGAASSLFIFLVAETLVLLSGLLLVQRARSRRAA